MIVQTVRKTGLPDMTISCSKQHVDIVPRDAASVMTTRIAKIVSVAEIGKAFTIVQTAGKNGLPIITIGCSKQLVDSAPRIVASVGATTTINVPDAEMGIA